MADEKKKNKLLPYKDLPTRFKVMRIIFVVLEGLGLIMTIIGTALGIAGIGILISGLLTFLIPGLVIAIIDYKLETKYRDSLEANKANGASPTIKAEEAKPLPKEEPALEPEPEPAPIPEPAPVVEEVEPTPEPVIEEPAPKEPELEPEPQPVYQANDNNGNPERKPSKKGLILILIIVGAIVLVGGGVGAAVAISRNMKNKNGEDGPKDDDYSYVIPSSNAPSSSSVKPTTSAVTSKTPKNTMIDICNNVFARGARFYDDYPEDYNYFYSSQEPSGFYATVYCGSIIDPIESNLKTIVEVVAEQMPTYLRAKDYAHSGTWGEGENGYFQNFVDMDGQTKVELGSYLLQTDEGNDIACQIYVTFNI